MYLQKALHTIIVKPKTGTVYLYIDFVEWNREIRAPSSLVLYLTQIDCFKARIQRVLLPGEKLSQLFPSPIYIDIVMINRCKCNLTL